MCVLKNSVLIVGIVGFFLVGCSGRDKRTDSEMVQAATAVYQDYLFEYGIDGKLFLPATETLSDETKIYKWTAIGSASNLVGVSVTVTRMKNVKPEMTLIGSTDAWLPLVGSKRKADAQ